MIDSSNVRQECDALNFYTYVWHAVGCLVHSRVKNQLRSNFEKIIYVLNTCFWYSFIISGFEWCMLFYVAVKKGPKRSFLNVSNQLQCFISLSPVAKEDITLKIRVIDSLLITIWHIQFYEKFIFVIKKLFLFLRAKTQNFPNPR